MRDHRPIELTSGFPKWDHFNPTYLAILHRIPHERLWKLEVLAHEEVLSQTWLSGYPPF